MTRLAVLSLAVLPFASVAWAQDEAVPLKNGQVLVGKITQKNDSGITLEKWDGSGAVTIAWNQIPERSLPRFKETSVKEDVPEDSAKIEGIRLVTSYRVVDGIIDREDDATIWIRTKDSETPLQFPKNGIVAREKIWLREADIYTPTKRVDMRVQKAVENGEIAKPDTLIELGEFCMTLGLAERAKNFYADAINALKSELDKTADENAKSKLSEKIESLENRIKQFDGAAALDAIKKLLEKNDYDAALQKAQAFLTDFEGTKLQEQNADLVDRINRERDEFKANRDKVLSKKIVEIAQRLMTKYVREASKSDNVAEAMKNADGIDQKIKDEVKDTYKISDEELNKWWNEAEPLRAEKKRRANMSTGTWIVKGGQDGGFDSGGGGRQGGGGNRGGGQPPQGGSNPLDDFRRRVGGGQPVPGMPGQGQGGQGGPQADPRKKLQTKNEWWLSQTASVREEFIEAYWATKSSLVQSTRKETEKKCTLCNGAGTLKAQRYNQFVDVVCSRCHGSQVEIEVIYW